MTTYENSLRMMEQEKILLDEKIQNCSKTLPDFDETFRTAMSFLSNPYTMWVSEDITLKRIALRLVFSEKITYAIKQGFRTPQMAGPIRISRGFSDIDTNEYDMVRLPRLELGTSTMSR
jgi:predicted double-glycine peptidase